MGCNQKPGSTALLRLSTRAYVGRPGGVRGRRQDVVDLLKSDETRRSAAYSAYGCWLIRRLDSDTDGKAVLALWREISWKRTGSPLKDFKLVYSDFLKAEESLAGVLQSIAVRGAG